MNVSTVDSASSKTISFNIPADLNYYYANISFTDDADLNYRTLSTLTKEKHQVILYYSQRHDYLYAADEAVDNPENVILMYSGESRFWQEYTSTNNPYTPQTFNTEHIYPQSRLTSEEAVSDLHHLRVCDAVVNEERLNYPFTAGNGTYKLINGNSWYPGDDWRGDVARMVLYLNIRYQETFEKVGSLELFLQWNVADPVSDFEIQRNRVIESAQGNRNPFIDNPFLATIVWGGAAAENKWE
ncbi:MAG: endonuclease [Maribacter sp.]|nr:endonuclease [Maribacter sp.]